jgi:hypothetical protein
MSYQLDDADEIHGQDLAGETVVLSEEGCHGLIDSSFSSGTLKLAQSKGRPMILRSVVKDSDVIAVKRQRDYPLFKARFINCCFHGVFSGIDFGRSHNTERDGDFGAIEGCDFTAATLDGCRFVSTDVSTLTFPRGGHAVLVEPYKRAADVAAIAWPGHLGQYMEICTARPESFKALVMHLPSLARLVRCTEDEVKEALQKFGGLVMER